MSSVSTSQLTLNFEPSIAERWPSLRSYLAHSAMLQQKSFKTIAADMDISPSTLTRKLNPGEVDTQRFNLDDLEGYIQSTGDVDTVIEYLAAKYKDSPEQRKARTISKVEAMLPELVQLLGSLKAEAQA